LAKLYGNYEKVCQSTFPTVLKTLTNYPLMTFDDWSAFPLYKLAAFSKVTSYGLSEGHFYPLQKANVLR